MSDVVLYERQNGHSPFADWFDALDRQAAAKVTIAVERLRLGNFSSIKSVGSGVLERRIDWGPGYRLYFGRDGENLVILLIGGAEQRQGEDIARAKRHCADYKRRKV
jgi:putative addiction module killer protein